MKEYKCNYSCSTPLIDDIRRLSYKDKAKVIKAYHKALAKDTYWQYDMFFERFEEDYANIDFKNLDDSLEWIGYAVNDLSNSLMCVDLNSPMTFFDVAEVLNVVIEKCKLNS